MVNIERCLSLLLLKKIVVDVNKFKKTEAEEENSVESKEEIKEGE